MEPDYRIIKAFESVFNRVTKSFNLSIKLKDPDFVSFITSQCFILRTETWQNGHEWFDFLATPFGRIVPESNPPPEIAHKFLKALIAHMQVTEILQPQKCWEKRYVVAMIDSTIIPYATPLNLLAPPIDSSVLRKRFIRCQQKQ